MTVDDLGGVRVGHAGRRNVVEVAVEHEARWPFAEEADDVAQRVDGNVPVAELHELRRHELGGISFLSRKARGRDEPLGEGDELALVHIHGRGRGYDAATACETPRFSCSTISSRI